MSDDAKHQDSPKEGSPDRSQSRSASRSPRRSSTFAKPQSRIIRVKSVGGREYDLLEEDDYSVGYAAKELIKKGKEIYLPTKEETRGFTWLDWFGFFLPCVTWLRTYDIRNWLIPDVLAGLSVGAMVIPQGMSYANLAGLPAVYGLYGAFVPCIVYSLFGSSRQLAVGPVAVTSMILGTGLTNMFSFVNPDPNKPVNPAAQEEYNHAAIQVAFLAGIMYTGIGLLRLGWLTNFLSHTTISGFMSGACIIIALSQVKYVLGLSIPRADKIIPALQYIFENLQQFQWREFVMSMAFIWILLFFRWAGNRYRRLFILKAIGPLTVCIISIALMNIFGWYKPGGGQNKVFIKPIGNIPKGMPDFTAGWFFPLINVSKQIVLAVVVCLIDLCESISIARAMAQKNNYRLNPTQELRGLGYANIMGALFNCYTTTGSFSRSAINNSIGAKTLLSSFSTGILLMITLLALTPVFKNMSANVQGAVIIVGVLQLFDYNEWWYLWKVNKLDWVVWNVTFLFVLFFGVEIGIGVSVGLSLVLVIYKSAFPKIDLLGRLPGSTIYRNVKMYPAAEHTDGVIIIRVDAPIYYANVENVKDYVVGQLEEEQKKAAEHNERLRYVILDLAPVTDVDSTAVHFFHDFLRILGDHGVKLVVANPSREVIKALRRGDIIKKIGRKAVHVDIHDAVLYAQDRITQDIKKETVEGV